MSRRSDSPGRERKSTAKTSRSRRNEPFSPPTNEKRAPQSPTKPTETQAIQNRTQSTQSPRRSGDERQHRTPESYIAPNPPQQSSPAAAMPREEVERCRRDRRRDSQIPSPVSMTAPARSNKIPTYDVVFSSGEARRKSKAQRRFRIKKQATKTQRSSLINNQKKSPNLFGKPTASPSR